MSEEVGEIITKEVGVGENVGFFTAMASGGVAGFAVDVALFPLDTIKTRLQAPNGFFNAGGFRGIYNGLSAAAVGSVPGASLFFVSYEMTKPFLSENIHSPALAQMFAASFSETIACSVRVPTEVVKQRMQAGLHSQLSEAVSTILAKEGVSGMFSGYGITVLREIPFSAIQFPIYEYLKLKWSTYRGKQVDSYQAAACGSFAGGIAAAITTPLDVIKTRLMLGADKQGVPYKGSMDVAKRVLADESAATFFSGVQPRVMWISIGGFVFFGAYEGMKRILLSW